MDIHVMLGVAVTLLSTQADKCGEEQHCSNCSSTTQHCTSDCLPGYYGLKCNSLCSKTCKNSACILTLNGIHRCSDGCVPGFRGTRCDTACTSSKGDCTECPQGCNGTFCHLTSSCVSGCHDSYYGFNCKNCSPRCRHCNRMTGKCIVCNDPYSGQDCQFSCENCSTTDCVQTCAPGLYGRTCSIGCSENCLVYPIANTSTSNSFNSCFSECERDSGECISGCVHGWFGPSCTHQIQCSSYCMGCNETGACIEGCLSGFYGDDCKPCSETCFNHTCHPRNGSCDTGCIRGHHGHICNESCTNCPGGACHADTGICAEEAKGNNTLFVLGIGLPAALVLLIIGASVFLLRLCQKPSCTERDHLGEESLPTEGSRQLETGEYYPIHRYWDIDNYDEVSQPQEQQRRPAEEEHYDEVSQRQGPQPGLAEEGYEEVSHRQEHQQRLAEEGYEEVSHRQEHQQRLAVEDNRDLAPPDLADYFPGAVDTEDNSNDTSSSSVHGSQSYMPSLRDVYVDDQRTVVAYISPTVDIALELPQLPTQDSGSAP